MLLLKMRFYHYKELMKLMIINRNTTHFESSRNSVLMIILLPSAVALGFNMVSPFSIFRSVGVYGSVGASIASFMLSFKDEMHVVAQNDKTDLGYQVRYRYS